MRLAGLILALLLSGGSASWAASQDRVLEPGSGGTVPVTPLGPEEVLLEIDVTGVSTLPGEIATVSVPLARSGTTPSAARAALAAEAERIVAAARGAGVRAADIRVIPREDPRVGFVAMEPDLLMAQEAATSQPRRHWANAFVQITLSEPGRYDRLRDSIETAETSVPAPVHSLRDPERGRRDARSDAIRRARAEAEDYARSIGMRVGRLVRVSARDYPDQWVVQMMRLVSPDAPRPASVETRIALSADFALVPNR